jgi:heme exporter protein A
MSLEIRDLVIGYDSRPLARVRDFDLAPGRVTVVTGPNGAGKTTLLKTLAGLQAPLSGTVRPRLGRGPGGAVFVHSRPFLFSGTVKRNMRLQAGGEGRARAALRAFEVEPLWDREARYLSHGQLQRVALARATAAGPAVLLADEPDGGLDAQARACLHAVIREALDSKTAIIVIASHHPAALGAIPTEVVTLDGSAPPPSSRPGFTPA